MDQAAGDSLHIEFKLQSDQDLVAVHGQAVTLGEVMAYQRSNKPDCHICYHNMDVSMEDPKKFTLDLTHKVVFQPKDDNVPEVSTHNLGYKEKLESWSSEALQLLWVVRWTAKGLMPVKPAVRLNGCS